MQINKFMKTVEKMCTPAQLYLGLSVLSIVTMIIQNIANPDTYCCGSFEVKTPINKAIYFVFKF